MTRLRGCACLLLMALLLSGCQASGARPSRAAIEDRDLTVDHYQRHYRVFVPALPHGERALPVVLVLHGTGDNGEAIEAYSGFDTQGARHGFLAVYPKALFSAWNSRLPATPGPDGLLADDVRFLAAVLDDLAKRHDIDRHRVYASGHSSGARMALRFGCERPDLVAAAAPVNGGIQVPCHPRRALPVLQVQGQIDPITLIESTASIPIMLTADSCPERPTTTRTGQATVSHYGPCRDGAEYAYAAIARWGHGWPMKDVFDTAAESWRFFTRFATT